MADKWRGKRNYYERAGNFGWAYCSFLTAVGVIEIQLRDMQ
jgi:hypothetical protein